jgi:hypothetical protein
VSARARAVLAEISAATATAHGRAAHRELRAAAHHSSHNSPGQADASPPGRPNLPDAPDATGPHAVSVVKSSDEQRYTLGLAYPSGSPDDTDAHNEYMTAPELERTAWSYVAKGRIVGLWHVDGTEGSGTVVESYIWRGPDWTVGDTVIKSGDWLLGVVWDPASWGLVKAGLVNGLSIQGTAVRRPVAAP